MFHYISSNGSNALSSLLPPLSELFSESPSCFLSQSSSTSFFDSCTSVTYVTFLEESSCSGNEETKLNVPTGRTTSLSGGHISLNGSSTGNLFDRIVIAS